MANRKPVIVLKREDNVGGVHKIEVFMPVENLFVIHRHSLVDHGTLAGILGYKRMFFGKFYCMQEIVFFQTELKEILKFIKTTE